MSYTALLQAINAASLKVSLCLYGRGSSAISMLAGEYQILRDAQMLGNIFSISHVLNYTPKNIVHRTVAQQLAQHAFHQSVRTMRLARTSTPTYLPRKLVGVGVTSPFPVSGKQRNDGDMVYICVWNGAENTAVEYEARLPSEWSMTQQEEQVSLLVLYAISMCAERVGPSKWIGNASSLFTSPTVRSLPIHNDVDYLVQRVLEGELSAVVWNSFGEVRCADIPFGAEDAREPGERGPRLVRLLYPGSYRPLHWGHTELARASAETVLLRTHDQQARLMGEHEAHEEYTLSMASTSVTYEIAVCNADKGQAHREDIVGRMRPFLQRGLRLAITSSSLFIEKAALFPGHGFIVGVDTAKRILDPKYYGEGGTQGMVETLLKNIGGRQCYFVVGGRTCKSSSGEVVWEDMASLQVPEELRELFVPVSEQAFRVDVSSTELRARCGII